MRGQLKDSIFSPYTGTLEPFEVTWAGGARMPMGERGDGGRVRGWEGKAAPPCGLDTSMTDQLGANGLNSVFFGRLD